MKKVVSLTGAGMSRESGLKTFREAAGLWEGHDVMEVASPQGFAKNPALVLEFYNQRRRQLLEAEPNAAHYNLVELEKNYEVHIVTQNVDDLHERAGSSSVLHLHGELFKVKSSIDDSIVYEWKKDLHLGDLCPRKSQLRPQVVWFGEDVPKFTDAVRLAEIADIFIVIGTSMQVYPAASLMQYTNASEIYFIDPNPNVSGYSNRIEIISEKATVGTEILLTKLC
ncbi:MAG: NAD-dependent protein deacylase [Flavobacteriaceae bacterium]|nr:NAD-dependent protein deacylase [Flavobacteriaceae bacterium]|tara:strand:- start:218114 stop:218788 length:675 start_codon:yes stop_codon:yes gene_type:complete